MSAILDTQEQRDQLTGFIKASGKAANVSLVIAVILILAGFGAFAFSVCCAPPNNDHYVNSKAFFVGDNLCGLIIALLIEIAAIILVKAYKQSLNQIAIYTNELIALRDLDTAYEISQKTQAADVETTATTGGVQTVTKHKTQQSKMEQIVIEALLSRCGK